MRSFLFAFVILVAVTAPGSEPEKPPVENVGNTMVAFGAHLETHPLAGADDLYKFLHQAVFGPGHAIPNREAAASWLEREIENLDPLFDGELLCEALGGEPPLVRVNLRPFIANGGNSDELLDAFVASANLGRGTTRRMEAVLSLAASYVQCAGRGELAPELKALSAELAEQDYPAIHHSEAYVEAYHPAYRVVDEAFAAERGWCD
ncbi:MAG: hypothetical protein OQK55_09640 [Thermoanaerobaculales bacterium]|nr:hypothetical protein [Thermoanaerobaculales bacterium]